LKDLSILRFKNLKIEGDGKKSGMPKLSGRNPRQRERKNQVGYAYAQKKL
jgi:hypothetical protein